jgi:hypothetical protein
VAGHAHSPRRLFGNQGSRQTVDPHLRSVGTLTDDRTIRFITTTDASVFTRSTPSTEIAWVRPLILRLEPNRAELAKRSSSARIAAQTFLQIDQPVVPERQNRFAGPSVDLFEVVVENKPGRKSMCIWRQSNGEPESRGIMPRNRASLIVKSSYRCRM